MIFHPITLRHSMACALFLLAAWYRAAPALTLYLAILAITAAFWWRLDAWLAAAGG